ncbi:MAG TPA: hypothetical protein VMU98_02705 [Acidimicrobiales bacterium]|nr:hypothetical protein [Acidimicrobiales bacterium]
MNILRPFSRVFAVVAFSGVALVTPTFAGASSAPTAATLISATKAQLLKEKSVHISVVSVSTKSKSTVSVDLGLTKGQEFLVSGAMKVGVLVTPKAAYLSGNAAGLTKVMGLTSAEQGKVGQKWVEMSSGTTPYTNLVKNLTTVALEQMLPVAKGTKLSTSSDKAKDYRLAWTTSSTATATTSNNVMLISSGKKSLPVSQTISTLTGHGVTTYSNWNKDFTVKIPKSSATVTFKSVFG